MFNSIIFFIFSYDIWFYISHIFLHNIFLYKNIHRIHHSINYENINYKDTYIGHFIEGSFQGLGFLFPLFFIDLNLYIIFISLILINIRGMLRHDKRFIWLIGNHHILHHKYPRYNFGEYWLDKLFRTNYPNINEYDYGLIYM
jgi:lathosterol oxidase